MLSTEDGLGNREKDDPRVGDIGPGRALRRIGAQLRQTLLRLRIGERWEKSEDGFVRRVYPDYETYVRHQKTKLDAARSKFVLKHDARFYTALSDRLTALPFDFSGATVLCIAARQGTEVRAFIEANYPKHLRGKNIMREDLTGRPVTEMGHLEAEFFASRA